MTSEPLEALLDRDPAELEAWQASRFGQLVGPGPLRLVLCGAGGLGRKTLAGLRRMGIEPLAFCDRDTRLQEAGVGGLEVLSPEEGARRFGDQAVFLVTVLVGTAMVRARLQALGCRNVLDFPALFWTRPDLFLPHYAYDLPSKVLASRADVLAAGRLLADPESAAEYFDQVRWRLDPEATVAGPPAAHPIYFPPGLVHLSGEEVFVDCGAFTGDTFTAFLKEARGRFRHACLLEPDPRNHAGLQKTLAALPASLRERIQVLPAAVADAPGMLRFSMQGLASNLNADGEVEVECRTLDDILQDTAATFIKMDVEGAELLALAGAAGHIRRHRPRLAISAYHCQDHLWKIPLFLHGLGLGYRFHYRRYSPHFLDDLVLYAIP